MPSTNTSVTGRRVPYPEKEVICQVLMMAFADLEQDGYHCTSLCREGVMPCAFHFFARWTEHLNVMCNTMGLTRAVVVDRVTAYLFRFLRRVEPTTPERDRQRAIDLAAPVAHAEYTVTTRDRIEYRRRERTLAPILQLVPRSERACVICGGALTGLQTRYCQPACYARRNAVSSARFRSAAARITG